MSHVTNQNTVAEESAVKTSPRRTRKSSQKESSNTQSSQKMSAKLPEVTERNEESTLIEGDSLIQKEEFSKRNTAQKLDSVADAINKMYQKMNEVTDRLERKIRPVEDAVFNTDMGMLPQLETMVDHATSVDERIQTLSEENLQLRDELDLLKGIVHKVVNQMDGANGKINQLIAKSMEDNLVVTGVLGDLSKKNARKQFHHFLREEMGLINIEDNDILKVYRIGQINENRARPLMVCCTPDLRRYILANSYVLKDRLNEEGSKFYINQQLPESIAEQNREIRQIIRDRQTKEELLPNNAKSRFLVRNNKVLKMDNRSER